MKKLIFPFLFVSIRVLAASALGPMPAVDSVSDLAAYRAPSTQPYIAVRRFAPDRSYWPEERIARYDATATNTIRSGCVDASPTGVGRYIFDDCFDTRPIDIRWLGGESVLLTGMTNRFTASFIPVDSMPAWEAARDLKAEQGGGVVQFEYGEYRFGSDTNPGSFVGHPKVSVRGAIGPMGDETHEGTYANDNVARTMVGTAFHIYNAGTNGAGLPPMVFSSKLVPAFTNSLIAYFGDANNEVVNYFRGGISVENIGIFGSWDWPWGGSPYPGAAVVIDEVAGITFKNVYFGPSTGPSMYARGAFGLRVYDFFSDVALSPAFTIVDTSDTRFSRGTVAAARGAAFSFTGELRTNGTFLATANTHIIDDVDVWNNAEDLVAWVGTSQTTTNYTITESSGVRRTGWLADPIADIVSVPTRIGSDSGMPVMVKGTDIPGGLNTNAVYYVKWGSPAGGTNFYLCNTSGRAINGGAVVDITSNGTNWWLEGPSSLIFARDVEEIKIDGMRADQSMSGVIDYARLDRALISGLFAWEVGLNQTEVRQSRKQTFWDPNIIAIRLEDVNSFNIAGSSIIGSKGNTSLSTPWVHNAIGIVALNVTDAKISGLFDRLNTGIYLDNRCGFVDTDGAAFGSWVSRPIDSTEGYGVFSHVPYFNGNTNSQIVTALGAAHTNITGDFAIALKARVSEATTNGWANGRHSALLNLSSITNTTAFGALAPKCLALSTWRSPVNNSINLVVTLGGTNYDQSNPSTERFAVGVDVTPFIGKDIEIVVQRATNYLQMYIEGQLKLNTAINNSTTGNLYAPYLLMGQIADSSQFSHPQAPIYGMALHRSYFTRDEINGGKPWTRHGGTNAVVYWDFDGATLASGVKDWSGNGHDGVVQQIGATAPSFGSSREYQVFAGTGINVTRNGKRSITVSSSLDTELVQDIVGGMITAGSNAYVTYNDPAGLVIIDGPSDEDIQDKVAAFLVAGANITLTYDDPGNTLTIASTGGGSTNGSSAFFNSTYLSAFNLMSSADITNVVSGTNVAPTLITQSGVSGTYTNPIATVNSKGIITAITNGTASSGGGSGTNVFVNNVLMQPAKFTNNTSSDAGRVMWYTNAGGDILAYATNLPAGGSSSNTIVLVEGTAVTNPNFTNTDANIDLSIASSTNVVVNMSTNPSVVQLNAGTVYVTNAMDVIVGATGRSNLTSEAYLVGQGTNAVKLLGPTANAIAGWNGSTATALTTGVGVTNTGGVVSINVASGSNVTLSTNSNGQLSIAASAGTTTITNNFIVSTNNLGYLERSVVLRTNDHTIGELDHYTITIPGNTLSVDGDEVEIHIPGTFSAYTTGTNSAYTFRWSFDSALGGADNVHVVNMASTYFNFQSDEYSLDWKLRIKRIDSNTVVTSSEHFAGPHIDAGSTNNLVSALGTMWVDFDGNLSSDPADFTLYTDIVDDTRIARLKTFGYLVHKVGSGSGGTGGGSIAADGTATTNLVSGWFGKWSTTSSQSTLLPQEVQTASSASWAPAFDQGMSHEVTMTNNLTLSAPSGVTADMVGQVFRLVLIQDSTGNRSVTPATNYLFGSDITGIYPSTNAGSRTYYSAYVRRTNVFDVIAESRGYSQ